MNEECIVQFELKEDEMIFEMILSYSPQFFIGQKIHLSNSIQRGFEEKWKEDLELYGDYEVIDISQSFESRYYHNKKDLHFVTVKIKGVK